MRNGALLALLSSLPQAVLAGSVPVCDGTLSQIGPDGSGNYQVVCSVAWRFTAEPVPSWLSTLSIEDAGSLAASALLLWAVAWVLRQIFHAIDENAP